MRLAAKIKRLLDNLVGRDRLESTLDAELRGYLDEMTERKVRQGILPAEARRQALLEAGGLDRVKEQVRDAWLGAGIETTIRDVHYAVRSLRRSPGFTIAALVSLALGIGANTAIFSILHALVLRSLPVSDPQRLVVVTRNGTVSSPYPLFLELRDHSQTLEGVLAFRTTPMRLSKDGETERITGVLVSGTYFDVLGVRPSIGTAIANEDDRTPGSGGWRGPVVVLSHNFWLRRFGGQASAVGTRILLDGRPFTVVGVGPPGFQGTEVGEPADVFAPMTMQEALLPGLGTALTQPRSQWLRIFGRLRSDGGIPQAEAELTTLLRRYNQEYFIDGASQAERRRSLLEQKIVLIPGATGLSSLRSGYSMALWVLISVVALVLLIACANVANLMLSRAAARRREIAIRLSLGAARSRLVGQLLIESFILAISGAGSGLLLARWMRDLLIRYLPADRSLDAPMEPKVLLFTLLLGVGAALFFGLVPALQSTSVAVAPAIKGEEVGGKAGRILFRKGLVVFQMSLSFLLLIAAGLFLRSLHNLLTIDPGFARESILVASVEGGRVLDLQLLGEVRNLPGVVSAALADSPPLGTHTGWNIYVPGHTPKTAEQRDSPQVGFVSPGYFATMGIPLLLGRDIDDRDVLSARNVMVVNETFAKDFFGGANPIGRRVGTTEGVYQWEIIGVVKNSKYTGLREGPVRMIYVPARPGPWASHTVVHLRTYGNPAALASALRQKVQDLDKTAAIFNLHTVQEEVDRSLLRERLVGTVTGLFGGLALALAAIGLYGLTSYGAVRRTREFGIRIAIGATTGSIVGLVVSEALWLLAAGTAIGLLAAWLLGRVVEAMLFGIGPADPVSAVFAIIVLSTVVLFAACIPARRAAKVDPMRALRWD
jgi:predicted permease